jgi:hypothetical protein
MQQTIENQKPELNTLEHFKKLNAINVNDRTEIKKNGKTELTYLSWAWAWAEVKKVYPNATYEIETFENNLPYVYDEKTGYMVFTNVTIEGINHRMWLPVMDGANKAMKSEPYEYETKYNGTKIVETATMFDINKTIMRCLTKNLAMFGLGLYIFAGEDLPESEEQPKEKVKKETKKTNTEYATFEQKNEYRTLVTPAEYASVMNSNGGRLPLAEYERVKIG